jgi:hypothetical protein
MNVTETTKKIVAKAEEVVGRPLDGLEESLIEYAVIQIKLDLLGDN